MGAAPHVQQPSSIVSTHENGEASRRLELPVLPKKDTDYSYGTKRSD